LDFGGGEVDVSFHSILFCSPKTLDDWDELQGKGFTIYKNKTSGILQRQHPCDAEFLEVIRRFKVSQRDAAKKLLLREQNE
jgi:hypothetical protein